MRFLRQLVPRRGSLPKLRRNADDLAMLRWASLPVTNRRWTAPLSAAALGMGLFVGVAMSPRVDDTEGAPAAVVASTAPPEAAPTLAPPIAGAPGTSPPPPATGVPSPPEPPTSPSTGDLPSSTPPIFPTPDPITPTPSTPIVPTDSTSTTEETTADEPTTTQETTEPLELTGTVAHVNPLARSYTLATADGRLSAIHAKSLPQAGTRFKVPVRQLANGTFAEDGQRNKKGSRGVVEVGGLVTWRDPGNSRFTISDDGVSALVVADGSLTIPNVGALVVVTARIEPSAPPADETGSGPQTTTTESPPTSTTTPETTTTVPETAPQQRRTAPGVPQGCGVAPHQPAAPKTVLTATKIDIDSEFAGSGDAEGVVQGVCRSQGELIISADDQRAGEADVTLELPADSAIDLGAVDPGDVVSVSAAIDEQSKRLELTGLGRDRGAGEADDASLQQGG